MTRIRHLRHLTIIMLAVVFMIPSIALASEDTVSNGDDQLAQTAGVTVEAEAGTVDFDLGDTDALYEQYVNRLFYGNPAGPKPAAVPKLKAKKITGDRLEGQDKELYDGLKESFGEIASGEWEYEDTELNVPLKLFGIESDVRYTAEGLGLEDTSYLFKPSEEDPETGVWNPEVPAAADRLFQKLFSFDANRVINCLLADCAYEMYWSTGHSTYPTGLSYSWGQEEDGTEYIQLEPLGFKFQVDPKFRADPANEYSVDTEKTKAAADAVQNARKILDDASGKDDYHKLVSYKDAICDLVVYDNAAASGESEDDMGPWALVYVFDGNPDTNVVCEGYAEARVCHGRQLHLSRQLC